MQLSWCIILGSFRLHSSLGSLVPGTQPSSQNDGTPQSKLQIQSLGVNIHFVPWLSLCHRHRQVSAICTLWWLWYWACSHNGVLWAGNQVECLHWAGHCITLGHCPPDQNLIPVHCVHCLPVHCTVAPSTLSATVLASKWHYHCPKQSLFSLF